MDFLGDGGFLDVKTFLVPGDRVFLPGHAQAGEIIATFYQGPRKPGLIRVAIHGVGVVDVTEEDVEPI